LLNRLFYVGEPLDRLPKLLSRWTPGTNTREYLCDLCELCHVSLKLLEGSSKNDSVDTQQKKISGNNNVEKMKLAAAEFDVMSYFCRKIVSNQLVNMYVHLLGQYRLNSVHVNHHIIAMFLRLSHTEIASPDIQDVDSPINMLGSRRVTYEPMLYNIHLFLVMEKILSDCVIRNDKDFASLVNFCSSHMYKFWSAAQANPMAYIECLFRHLAPHRFCESFTNLYVSEELRMVAERELLLEQQRHETDLGDSGNGDYEDEDDEEVEFTGEPVQGVQKEASGLSDSEEEADSENIGSLPSQKAESAIVASENKRGKDHFAGSLDHERSTKKSKTIESDDEVDFSGAGSADVSKTMFTDDD
jgi:timeless